MDGITIAAIMYLIVGLGFAKGFGTPEKLRLVEWLKVVLFWPHYLGLMICIFLRAAIGDV